MKKVFCTVWFCLFFGIFSAYSQMEYRTEVFTLHPDSTSVTLYEDPDLIKKRIDIYPDPYENNVGVIMEISGQWGDVFRVCMGTGFWVPIGKVGVITRNYDGALLCLYAKPSRNAPVVLRTHSVQIVPAYGLKDGWLYVEAVDDNGIKARGWLAPDMQCGNPYTTCG